MAFRKSPSSARSAPKAKQRLAAFSAYVEALASGDTPANDALLARGLKKPSVARCSAAWKTFAQQVASTTDRQRPAVRVLPPWQSLPPLP